MLVLLQLTQTQGPGRALLNLFRKYGTRSQNRLMGFCPGQSLTGKIERTIQVKGAAPDSDNAVDSEDDYLLAD